MGEQNRVYWDEQCGACCGVSKQNMPRGFSRPVGEVGEDDYERLVGVDIVDTDCELQPMVH